ncbi:MAG: phytanoyl-CoA dioxygenase family protein [Pseudomonadales bacterium]|jgi:hypothetical protein|nr:phytanoyl-CoA dioxygenase family protein [Pseudomonadales bacterium]
MNIVAPAPGTLGAGAMNRLQDGIAQEGVALLEGFMPASLCTAARRLLDRFRNLTDDPESWYGSHPTPDGAVPVHQAEALWNLRQYAPLHDLFRALLGTPFLWVSIDCGAINPPHRPGIDEAPRFHWEVDPRRSARRLQGLVYLEACAKDQGVYECVPGIFRRPEAWRAVHGVGPFEQTLIREQAIRQLPGGRGSLVLWDARMPHRLAPNTAELPSYSFRVTMFPEGDGARRQERISDFEARRAPAWARATSGQTHPEPGPAPVLTELGEQLLGRRPW